MLLFFSGFQLIWIDCDGYKDNADSIVGSFAESGARELSFPEHDRYRILSLKTATSRLRERLGSRGICTKVQSYTQYRPTSSPKGYSGGTQVTISVVIPVYNEAQAIPHNLTTIIDTVRKSNPEYSFHFIVVDDGSIDSTADKIREISNVHDDIELIAFTRNYGKEAAICGGLHQARGEATIIMDSDLQHPPEMVRSMLEAWKNGFKVVDACKSSRGSESILSKFQSMAFYFFFRNLTSIDITNNSDFKLLDSIVVKEYCKLSEKKRFFRALIPFLGFRTEKLFFEVFPREIGQTAWSRLNLIKMSVTALTGFTSAPLHAISFFSILFFLGALIIGGIALYHKITGVAVSGFTTVILLILLTGSLIMFALGQIGIYLEHMFDEIKNRPVYTIDEDKSFKM